MSLPDARTLSFTFTLAALAAPLADAAIYGVKTHDPQSQPPTHLFVFQEDGSGFADLGPLSLGGASAEIDALAWSPTHGLLAFELTGSASRMVRIDPGTAAVTLIGPDLPDTDLRGAVFDGADRLLVLDADADAVREVDPVTGLFVGPAVPLIDDTGETFLLSTLCDLALRADGTFYLSEQPKICVVDPFTGVVSLLHESGGDAFCGLAFSTAAASDDHLFAYDVNHEDDILRFDVDNSFLRTELHKDIIPGYNAGRGDLASTSPCAGAVASYGDGCVGSNGVVPSLALGGCPTVGATVTLVVEGGLAGSQAFLFLGTSRAALAIGGAGCLLNVLPAFGPFGPLPLDPAGGIAVPIVLPGPSAYTVTAQAFVQDGSAPDGFSTTNGLEVTGG